MKHVRAGITLLVVLGLLGAFLTVSMNKTKDTLSHALTRAADAALAENWEEADACTGQTRSLWEKRRKLTAAVVDHELLEEADSLLVELTVYRARKESTEFAAVCLCLAQQFEAIGESQSLRWWHLL